MRSLFLILIVITAGAYSQSLCGKQAYAIWSLAKKYHYDPRPLDDAFSRDIYDTYLESIDPGGYYFLQSDIDQLQLYRDSIDDQVKAKSTVFFDHSARLFRTRLKAVDSLVTVLETENMDLTVKETFSEGETTAYCPDNQSLKERWRKWLKYAVLDELFYGDYFSDPFGEKTETLLQKTGEVKKDVLGYERFNIKSYLNHPAGYENYLATYYLDAMARSFDPHTSFFSHVEKENFESELSKENLVFGFSVEEDDKGVVRISGLMPGSPAWRSNELNTGDEILALEMSDGQRVDMATAGIDEITLLFENSTSTKLTLEIRKVSGQEKKVVIEKGEVYIEEDVIKSVILEGEQKIGYITLPDFYTNWDGDGGLGCANDVASIIVKLQKENIGGLILDLRDNGGGSMKESLDLAGIFIDWGPLVVTSDNTGEPVTLKDLNKGAIYNGPLVILVNGLSASASELFTAAMQDYNRAIVVGNPTYGKATSQVVLPLDPNYIPGITKDKDVNLEYGYLKVTTGKLYRISNGTHQKTGIVPDIVLPDLYSMYDYRESSYPNALSSDSIVKKMYYTPFPEFPAGLADASKVRTDTSSAFQQIRGLIDSISRYETAESIAIDLETFMQQEMEYNALLDRLFGNFDFTLAAYRATNNQYDAAIMQMNAWRRELNEEYLQSIEYDPYIDEAYRVIVDYINSK